MKNLAKVKIKGVGCMPPTPFNANYLFRWLIFCLRLRACSNTGLIWRTGGGLLLTTTRTTRPLARRSCGFTLALTIDLVEIYQFDHRRLSIVTDTGPQFNDPGIAARTTSYFRSYRTKQFGN